MGLSNRIAGIIMALFLLGAVGGTAVVMASNATLFAGAPSGVITLFTVGVVSVAAVAIMLYFIPKNAVANVPALMVLRMGSTIFSWFVRSKRVVHGWMVRLIKKLGRN